MADVVLPAAAGWCESEGTVTNSERRVQRVRKALEPPGEARDDIEILCDMARRLGRDWGRPSAEDVWNELRTLSPMHAGMSYARLEEHGGLQWPCPDETHPGRALPPRPPLGGAGARAAGALLRRRVRAARRRARRAVPDPPDDRPAPRLLQHGRADRRLHLAAAAAASRSTSRPKTRKHYGVGEGERVRVTLAARVGAGSRALRHRAAARARVHDAPLPGRRRDEPPDDRRHRSEVRHGRVQGHGDPDRPASSLRRRREPDGSPPRQGAAPRPPSGEPSTRFWGSPRAAGTAASAAPSSTGTSPAADKRRATRRHLLLPALHAAQARVGFISEGALTYICQRLTVPPGRGLRRRLLLLDVLADAPRAQRRARLRRRRLPPEGRRDDLRADGAGARPGGRARNEAGRGVAAQPVPRALRAGAGGAGHPRGRSARSSTRMGAATADGVLEALREAAGAASRRRPAGAPAAARRARPAAPAPVGQVDPESLDDYRAHGGYEALRRAIELGPDGVIREVIDSKLVGRGGAAFPTGRKWEAVAKAPVRPHYLVCNADESEPGTFKDRVLMEEDPFAVVEAMTIAGYATGCERGYSTCAASTRSPPTALGARSPRRARAGFLGDDVMGQGFAVRRSSCGAARARTSAARRRRSSTPSRASAASRATSRRSRPWPASSASRPSSTTSRRSSTCWTSSSEPARRTPRRARRGSTGTKLFCVSGHVARPGLYEVPFGETLARFSSAPAGVAGRPASPGGAPRRRGGQLRHARGAPHAADLRGPARDRREPRLGRRRGLRRHGGPARHGPAHRRVLPRRVVRPVRALPRRHRAPGGGAPPSRPRQAARLGGRRRRGCSRRSARPCATPRSAASARRPRRHRLGHQEARPLRTGAAP